MGVGAVKKRVESQGLDKNSEKELEFFSEILNDFQP